MSTVSNFVTKEDCAKKLHIPQWVIVTFFSVFLGVMALFLTLVGYSAAQASNAATRSTQAVVDVQQAVDEAKEVATSLNTHEKVASLEKRSIIDKLEDIRKELYEHRQEQKLIMQKLIKLETQHYDEVKRRSGE